MPFASEVSIRLKGLVYRFQWLMSEFIRFDFSPGSPNGDTENIMLK